MAELTRLQAAAGALAAAESQSIPQENHVEDWDTIFEDPDEDDPTDGGDQDYPTDDSPPLGPEASVPALTPVAVELQPICLPSTRNVTSGHEDIELSLRSDQAKNHLHQLRELIAEKSFQYSHIIRVAPTKGVKTRARGTVKGLNMKIAFHCEVYSQCRSRMIVLGADDRTLRQFRELQKEHIKASTAILNPNIRGSTTLQLSWIWHEVAGDILPGADAQISADNAAAILECKSFSL